ncbi:NAD(+) synthase [Candidatus Falkowbacteria bacterium CG10_big_fil_rev_8_21_14_0_10_39_11]|uniref:Glutamine-dependent NAD(+) synthetase n=1 Tax=Candidatus Falkowbacteria bacterium CG10_big_fil_rev_8_21_14_0_10_39_11 TaxID=1974565 RepID=A0A2H0V691_9BACT|nr:MAG: NAD(+) synthase [Candidatus Falkowbacteria bacterium CG10_big_fil_rev_8_21_14_0_10_39_11]
MAYLNSQLIKIGNAVINTTVGAVKTNTKMIIIEAKRMSDEMTTIGVFPEMAINGYYPEDWLQTPGFIIAGWEQLMLFAEESSKFSYPTVYVVGVALKHNGSIFNCAAVVCMGKILGIVPKVHLANYNVFHEARVLTAGVAYYVDSIEGIPFGDLIFKFPFGTVAPEVCEDIWTGDGPMERRAYSGADIVVNISASPFRVGVVETRDQMLATRAADNQVLLNYCNLVGGNDSLVYDGGTYVIQNGVFVQRTTRKVVNTTFCVVDMNETLRRREQNITWQSAKREYLERHNPVQTIHATEILGSKYTDHFDGLGTQFEYYTDREHRVFPPAGHKYFLPGQVATSQSSDPRTEYFEDLLDITRIGLRDYFDKTGAFQRIVIALSGGNDSCLSLMIAYNFALEKFAHLYGDVKQAAIKDFIWCFSFPTKFNSEETKNVSRQLCEDLGVTFVEVPIGALVDMKTQMLNDMTGVVPTAGSIPLQNDQARARGDLMWGIANRLRALWIQTGNMSEKAVGYTTVGGDLMGAYSVLGNMFKSVILMLIQYLHDKYRCSGLKLLLATKASAELAENQHDEDDLMPFDVLDTCIELFAGRKLMPVEMFYYLRHNFPQYDFRQIKDWIKKFIHKFLNSIFKWVQAPQAVHLGALDLDRERALHLAVVNRCLEWLNLEALDDIQ